MSADYKMRPMVAADEPAVLALLRDSLAGGPTGERTPEFFRWKHHRSPFGASPSLIAEADEQVVGFRTFMRWDFRVGSATVKAVRAVDTATAAEHRGNGVFRLLTMTAIEELAGSADFVFNTPNTSSLPGYLKMGWQEVGDVPIHVRPVHWWSFLRNVRSARELNPASDEDRGRCPLPSLGRVLAEVAGVDELLDEIMDDDANSGAFHTRKNINYLRWRYAEAPGLDYRAVPLLAGGDLAGLAIGRPRRRGELREFTLSELLVRPGDLASTRRLLSQLRDSGCDHVAAHFSPGTAGQRAARRAGFLRMPKGMTLTTRVLREPVADPRSMSNWRLSVGDLEVF